MRIAIFAGVAGLALLGLSACNKPATPAASGAPQAAGAAPAASAPAAAPLAQFRTREGLWEQKMTIEGMGFASTSQICIDKSVQERMVPSGQDARAKCANRSFSRQLNGDWTFNATCEIGKGGTVSTTGTVHGDFDKAYEMEATSTISGADVPEANRTMKMAVQATWLGPCKPGQKPGDVIVNGMKMHMPGGRRVDLNGVKGLEAPGG